MRLSEETILLAAIAIYEADMEFHDRRPMDWPLVYAKAALEAVMIPSRLVSDYDRVQCVEG